MEATILFAAEGACNSLLNGVCVIFPRSVVGLSAWAGDTPTLLPVGASIESLFDGFRRFYFGFSEDSERN